MSHNDIYILETASFSLNTFVFWDSCHCMDTSREHETRFQNVIPRYLSGMYLSVAHTSLFLSGMVLLFEMT